MAAKTIILYLLDCMSLEGRWSVPLQKENARFDFQYEVRNRYRILLTSKRLEEVCQGQENRSGGILIQYPVRRKTRAAEAKKCVA